MEILIKIMYRPFHTRQLRRWTSTCVFLLKSNNRNFAAYYRCMRADFIPFLHTLGGGLLISWDSVVRAKADWKRFSGNAEAYCSCWLNNKYINNLIFQYKIIHIWYWYIHILSDAVYWCMQNWLKENFKLCRSASIARIFQNSFYPSCACCTVVNVYFISFHSAYFCFGTSWFKKSSNFAAACVWIWA